MDRRSSQTPRICANKCPLTSNPSTSIPGPGGQSGAEERSDADQSIIIVSRVSDPLLSLRSTCRLTDFGTILDPSMSHAVGQISPDKAAEHLCTINHCIAGLLWLDDRNLLRVPSTDPNRGFDAGHWHDPCGGTSFKDCICMTGQPI
jgi:hypothetical protein